MLGALIGDYVGSRFEFSRYRIPYDFTFYEERDRFTDDTVMSIAVAEAIMNNKGKSDEEIKAELVSSMRKWGRRYPDAGYGGKQTRNLISASETVPQCVSHPSAGFLTPWRKQSIWQS